MFLPDFGEPTLDTRVSCLKLDTESSASKADRKRLSSLSKPFVKWECDHSGDKWVARFELENQWVLIHKNGEKVGTVFVRVGRSTPPRMILNWVREILSGW